MVHVEMLFKPRSLHSHGFPETVASMYQELDEKSKEASTQRHTTLQKQ